MLMPCAIWCRYLARTILIEPVARGGCLRIIGMPGYVNVYRVVLLCVNMAFLSCPVHYKLQITVFFYAFLLCYEM